MGYYNKYGYVGDYKGRKVYVVNESYYTEDKIDSPDIYAIRQKNNTELDLVFKGYHIGVMWDDGNILTLNRTPWNFKKTSKPKVKSKPEVKVENKPTKEDSVDIDNYDFSVNFDKYSTVVNNVFQNLETWWKDLEKEDA